MFHKKIIILFFVFLIVSISPAAAVQISAANTQEFDSSINDLSRHTEELKTITDNMQNHLSMENILNIFNCLDYIQNEFKNPWNWGQIIEKTLYVTHEMDEIKKSTESLIDVTEKLKEDDRKIEDISKKISAELNDDSAFDDANNTMEQLKKHFLSDFTLAPALDLQKNDIVQYKTEHGNYIYLRFMGTNPSNNTLIFLGDKETAIKIPKNEAEQSIKYKITPQSMADTKPHIHYIATEQLNKYNTEKKKYTDASNHAYRQLWNSIDSFAVFLLFFIMMLLVTYMCFDKNFKYPCEFYVEFIIDLVLLISSVVTFVLMIIAKNISDNLYQDLKDFNKNHSGFELDFAKFHNGAKNIAPLAYNDTLDIEIGENITKQLNSTNPDELTYKAMDNTSHGKLTVYNNGTYSYTPDIGFIGNDSFTYVANDVLNDSNIATVNITVHPIIHPPIANNMTLHFETGSNITSNLNGTSEYGDVLSYILVDKPVHGQIIMNDNGTFTYTPDLDNMGNDTFTYKVRNWKHESNIATVTLIIDPFIKPPEASDMDLIVNANEDMSSKFNATDLEGRNLTYIILENPMNGTLKLNNDTFTYTPNKGFTGHDQFKYKVNNGKKDSNNATVNINVNPCYHPPIANNMTLRLGSDTTINNNFNATSPDGNNLTYIIVDKPAHGQITINENGTFTYTANKFFIGNDYFTYKAKDSHGESNISTITLIIYQSQPPVTGNVPLFLWLITE